MTRNIEDMLSKCALIAPPQELRTKILDDANRKKRAVPKSELVLQWCLALLVLVLAWGEWAERQTAERMAAGARASRMAYEARHPEYRPPTLVSHDEDAVPRVLRVRIPMPLPPGRESTTVPVVLTSLDIGNIGDPI